MSLKHRYDGSTAHWNVHVNTCHGAYCVAWSTTQGMIRFGWMRCETFRYPRDTCHALGPSRSTTSKSIQPGLQLQAVPRASPHRNGDSVNPRWFESAEVFRTEGALFSFPALAWYRGDQTHRYRTVGWSSWYACGTARLDTLPGYGSWLPCREMSVGDGCDIDLHPSPLRYIVDRNGDRRRQPERCFRSSRS